MIKTPGYPRYSPEIGKLAGAGVRIVGGLGLWLADADLSRVACITGTKGKSTTTEIAGHLLNRLGHRCLVGGNIGVLPFDPAVGDGYDSWVIEVSSYRPSTSRSRRRSSRSRPCTPTICPGTATTRRCTTGTSCRSAPTPAPI